MSEQREKPPEPIYDPDYWKRRLSKAKHEIHKAVFITSGENWRNIEAKHREILNRVILPHDTILDCGCGWGRLLDLLPKTWRGEYFGVDLSPDFISMARNTYPNHDFYEGSMEVVLPRIADTMNLSDPNAERFDWAVMISIRPMIVRNCGQQVWDNIEKQLRLMCHRLLYLEYDTNDNGEVIVL